MRGELGEQLGDVGVVRLDGLDGLDGVEDVADDDDRRSVGVGDRPVEVAATRHHGAGVAAAHRDPDVGSLDDSSVSGLG
ncbi:hypothetical protein [Streptomyces virginiae]|uniref:Uncharacterized protein n=1 Tax=Streptomyces virginiae TaxID=1961 RepID=A0ABZ1T761_STRVG|nr:hypothetical protein [Streptomyces virginiae]